VLRSTRSGISLRRSTAPAAIAALLGIIFLALWFLYGIWIRNADLRPPTQVAAAASLTVCIDTYKDRLGDSIAEINRLWSVYYLCDNIMSRKLLFEEQVIRNENFVFQRFQNAVIMIMVVSITVSGVLLAGLQLLASYKLAAGGKSALSETGEVTLSSTSIAVKSSVVGVIILAISFAFFFVYVLYVYTFTAISDGKAAAGSETAQRAPSISFPSKGRDVGQGPNVGVAIPRPDVSQTHSPEVERDPVPK
jgi:hypothetical protein